MKYLSTFNGSSGCFRIPEETGTIQKPPEKTSRREIALAFRNIHLETSDYLGLHGRKPILRPLDGSFDYHTLSGLMGPSGAGKTTLLNCLSGNERGRGLTNDWEIYLNKADRSGLVTSCFIEQHVQETVFGRLKVGEILRYAFQFKNRGNGSQNSTSVESYIKQTLAELLLDPSILERRFEVCSGGEQKRIAIAQELMSLTKPSFLFIDEPTTGLDSAAAYEVMHCLKQLTTAYRMTVVVSIHLPNNQILNLFDQLYVLAKGGVALYSGPPGLLGKYLEESQIRITAEEPPIETLLKIAGKGLDDFNVLKLHQKTLTAQHHSVTAHLASLHRQPLGIAFSHPEPFRLSHLALHLSRHLRVTFLAEGHYLLFQLALYAFSILFLATVFSHQMVHPTGCYPLEQSHSNATCQATLDRDALLTENINYLNFMLLFTGFLFIVTTPALFAPLLKVFQHEHRNKWYSLTVFYISSTAIMLLQVALISLVIASSGYFFSGQHAADQYAVNWARFGHFLLLISLTALYMQAIGTLIGATFRGRSEMAVVLAQMIFCILIMFNDFFFQLDRMAGPIFVRLADVVALKYLTRYLFYIFYGLNRCNAETEFSLVLVQHLVDSSKLTFYIARVLTNVLLLKLITWFAMYFLYTDLHDHFLVRVARKLFLREAQNSRRNALALALVPLDGAKMELFYTKLLATIELTQQVKIDSPVDLLSAAKIEKSTLDGQIAIAWRHLTLYASSSIYESVSSLHSTSKVILNDINGELRFGTLTGIMGTSGAGKTSCLKVLNGRNKSRLSEETAIYVSKYTPIRTAFITQYVDGHLLPGLTAKQSLVYASKLKNGGGDHSEVDHEAIALHLLEELQLSTAENTLVNRCSGGERKRLALALELTSTLMPNLICIDEPTSGLDSSCAETVISCLRVIAKKYHLTIVTSIHQPNSAVLAAFDQLYVLAPGGVCIYAGAPADISAQLDVKLGPAQNQQPPVERLIECSLSRPTVQILSASLQVAKSEELLASALHLPDGVNSNKARFSLNSVVTLSHRYLDYLRGHLWFEALFYILLLLGYGIALRLFFNPAIALPSGCIDLDTADFNSTCTRTPEGALDEQHLANSFKYNFFMNGMFLFLVLIQTSLTFGKEMAFFANEHRNGWYSSGAYYLTKSLFEILPMIPLIGLYIATVDLYSPVRPGIYWHLVFIFSLSAVGFQGVAQICSLLAKGNTTSLLTISLAIYFLFCLLGNFFVSLTRLHYIYHFIAQFSITRFSFESTILLEYGFSRCSGSREIQPLLYAMGIDDSHYSYNIAMLIGNLVLARLVALALLIYRGNPIEGRAKRIARIKMMYEKEEEEVV